jgi:hypothetical protein
MVCVSCLKLMCYLTLRVLVSYIYIYEVYSAGERPVAAHLLRSWVRLPPGAWIFVCCDCRVLSGRGLCDELIARPEESYRLWCVGVCDLETSRICTPYIYDISNLRVNDKCLSKYNKFRPQNFAGSPAYKILSFNRRHFILLLLLDYESGAKSGNVLCVRNVMLYAIGTVQDNNRTISQYLSQYYREILLISSDTST